MKQKLLADLYVLRAGLSQISLEKDQIIKEENQLSKLKNDYALEESKLNQANIDFSSTNYRIDNLDHKKQKETPIKAKDIFINIAIALLLSLFGPVIHALMNFFTYLLASGLELFTVDSGFAEFLQFGNFKAWGICCLGILLIALIVLFSIYGIKRHKTNKQIKESNLKSEEAYQSEKRKLKSTNREIGNSIATHKNNMNKINTMVLSQDEVYRSTSMLLSASSKGIYDSLVKQYKSVLDIRDWKYLDLIIFYFETGRADTLKEALQQVDRQVQTNEIIKAVKSASASICKTIESSMSSLEDTIAIGFNNLSNQLALQHEEQMGVLKQINSNIQSNSKYLADISAKIDTTNKYIEKINTTQELSNALLTKINVDSTKIWDDVDYMLYKAPKIGNTNFKA